MARDVDEVVGSQRWTTWEALTAQVSRSTVSAWLSTGQLIRPHPGVYLPAGAAAERRVRLEAVLRARRGIASHATALALWGLAPPGDPLHIVVDHSRSGRGTAGVVLHRTGNLDDVERRVDGLPVTSVERAVVDT